MNYLNNLFPTKMVVLTLLSLYLLMAISSSMAYMGTRYGKREPDVSRLQSRSIGQRSISNRGVRFYPGSRYGGKRSYWQPTSFVPSETDAGSADSPNVPSTPFDCIYVPFVGVRCSRPEDVSYWNNDEDAQGGSALSGSSVSSSAGSSVVSDQP